MLSKQSEKINRKGAKMTEQDNKEENGLFIYLFLIHLFKYNICLLLSVYCLLQIYTCSGFYLFQFEHGLYF